eukprot:567744-Prymnesium_polylepis.1
MAEVRSDKGNLLQHARTYWRPKPELCTKYKALLDDMEVPLHTPPYGWARAPLSRSPSRSVRAPAPARHAAPPEPACRPPPLLLPPPPPHALRRMRAARRRCARLSRTSRRSSFHEERRGAGGARRARGLARREQALR